MGELPDHRRPPKDPSPYDWIDCLSNLDALSNHQRQPEISPPNDWKEEDWSSDDFLSNLDAQSNHRRCSEISPSNRFKRRISRCHQSADAWTVFRVPVKWWWFQFHALSDAVLLNQNPYDPTIALMNAQGLNSKLAELSVKIIRRLASDGVAFHSWKGDGALALEGEANCMKGYSFVFKQVWTGI